MLHMNEPYLDRLMLTMETLHLDEPAPGIPDKAKTHMQKMLDGVDLKQLKSEDIRNAIQLAVIKGMKDSTQQQHLITPETIALIIAYLAAKFNQDRTPTVLFDPVSGSANLLTAVLEQMPEQTAAYAAEVDPTLVQLAVLNANLQKKEIEFFHQDSLQPMLLDPVDMVVADLPVGYYPDDVQAASFELNSEEGHAYAHHLMIEQSLRYTKAGGYLIFIVPAFLFESDQAGKLRDFIRTHAHIVGMLSLPESAFKDKRHQKSILILQKKGETTHAPKQPLLVQFPSFKDHNAVASVMVQMNNWFKTYQSKKQE
nr:class I SAM-dependent methyltransferase [Lentibacillus sp. JNUCC-1]